MNLSAILPLALVTGGLWFRGRPSQSLIPSLFPASRKVAQQRVGWATTFPSGALASFFKLV